MALSAKVEQLHKDREDTIQCLRRGEYGYAQALIGKLFPFMRPEFARQVSGHFSVCNYARVADLLEHLWKDIEVEDEQVTP